MILTRPSGFFVVVRHTMRYSPSIVECVWDAMFTVKLFSIGSSRKYIIQLLELPMANGKYFISAVVVFRINWLP